MVYEFGNLQGKMGEIYALEKGEDAAIATALSEQYLPHSTQENTHYPVSSLGILLSLADKIDTLVTCFQHDIIPTGSQDPWGLRRAVYAIMGICTKWQLPLSWKQGIKSAYLLWGTPKNQIQLEQFWEQKFKQFLQTQGLEYSIAEAVGEQPYLHQAQKIGFFIQLYQDKARLKSIVEMDERIENLVKTESTSSINETLMIPKEKGIWKDIQQSCEIISAALNNTTTDLNSLMTEFFMLSEKVNRYFEAVLIMDPNVEIQKNRQQVLHYIHRILRKVANFKKIKI